MSTMDEVRDPLIARLVGALPGLDPASAAALVDAAAAATTTYPGLELPLEAFAAHVLARLPMGTAVSDLHLADLYLACGCARGAPAAIALFERDVLARAAPAATGGGVSRALVDETLQQARAYLLVRADGRAHIEDYAGRGPLVGWLRIVLRRMRLKLSRSSSANSPGDGSSALELATDAAPGAEVALVRARHESWFSDALRRALSVLSEQEARVVAMHFRDGLSLSEIGARFGVNKSTVSRWLATARGNVFDALMRLARAELRISRTELESLGRLMRSRMRITLVQAMTAR